MSLHELSDVVVYVASANIAFFLDKPNKPYATQIRALQEECAQFYTALHQEDLNAMRMRKEAVMEILLSIRPDLSAQWGGMRARVLDDMMNQIDGDSIVAESQAHSVAQLNLSDINDRVYN